MKRGTIAFKAKMNRETDQINMRRTFRFLCIVLLLVTRQKPFFFRVIGENQISGLVCLRIVTYNWIQMSVLLREIEN